MENIRKESFLSVRATSIKQFDICVNSLQSRFSDEKKKKPKRKFGKQM